MRDEHHQVLHMLGLTLGVEEWMNDYKVRILAPSTEELPILGAASGMKPSLSSVVGLLLEPATEAIKEAEPIAAERTPETCDNPGKLVNAEPESRDMETDSRVEEIAINQALPSLAVIGYSDLVRGAPDFDLRQRSREIVEAIRRDEFGIGQGLKIQEQDLLSRQHARMGRALHRLSQDLYSQDSHFVLELVRFHHLY